MSLTIRSGMPSQEGDISTRKPSKVSLGRAEEPPATIWWNVCDSCAVQGDSSGKNVPARVSWLVIWSLDGGSVGAALEVGAEAAAVWVP